jgi:flagellar basal-body rod protein FlgC
MHGFELFPAMGASASGLDAERTRMEVAAGNLANSHSTRAANGRPFQRRQVVFAAVLDENLRRDAAPLGVRVAGIVPDRRPPVQVHNPSHPDADRDGMVRMPCISPIEEMMDMITASRAYEANLSALRQSRDMASETISMGRSNG